MKNNQSLSIFSVAGVSIRQDVEGRYCLNDLHKAAGGDPKHQPAKFFANDSTKDLLTEIQTSPDLEMTPYSTSKGGKDKGTYVIRELVYAYANWISPKFYLQVIRTYDALATGNLDALPPAIADKLTPAMLQQFGGVIKAVVHKQIEDALRVSLPAMVEASIASRQLSVRAGKTAGVLWKSFGLPTKGMRGYPAWFSHRLRQMGCEMPSGRAEMGGSTAFLFDPDKVAKAMKAGLHLACDQYVQAKMGQGSLRLVVAA